MALLDLVQRSKRYEDEDITPEIAREVALFMSTLDDRDEPDEFMQSMIRRARHKHEFSAAQARVTLNTLRMRLGLVDGKRIPDGTYTVVMPEGERRTFRLRTQKETARFAPGKQVLSYLYGPDNNSNYRGVGFVEEGTFVPWKSWEPDALLMQCILVLLQHPAAAAEAYGLESGRCGLCGRTLTVPESIQRGIGPVCASKAGW